MRTNNKSMSKRVTTHEGAPVRHIDAEQELRRSVMACMLWEDTFYESGESIADRIATLCKSVDADTLGRIAIEARSEMNLRHVPLLLVRELVRKGGTGVADVVAKVIQRPDELGELLSIYWKDGRTPIAKQLKFGLARAFTKFDEYQLAKYDRDSASIKLRDVMFLSHAKPDGKDAEALYAKIAERTLSTPDTWETGLSGGGDKKETFTRLLEEEKLGYLALLRNLRNMSEAGVDRTLVTNAIRARKGARRVLPFRFFTAVQHAPEYTAALDEALCEVVRSMPQIPGQTVVCCDTSASMRNKVSGKSETRCIDAAAVLASCIHGEDVRTLNFASTVEEVSHFYGIAGAECVTSRIGLVGHGTDIGRAVREAQKLNPDRIVVVTDGQSHTSVPDPGKGVKGYILNVACYQNGIGYGPWTNIDGFSEAVIRYMTEIDQD